jgi:molybdopterin-guanine dinucleotide biosynthesis protein A
MNTHPPFKDIAGLILVGGKSSRYGSNKAMVEVDGVRLIDRAVRVMQTLFQEVILLTNTPHEYAYLGLPMVEDLVKGLGPLGGVYTGLVTIPCDAGFFVACDMPFLNRDLIVHLVRSREGVDAVVPRVGWMIEPLHAVYTKKCVPGIRHLIDSRKYQIVNLFPSIRVRYVDEEEIRAYDPKLRSFFNINKPQDLPEAEKMKAGA